MALASNLVNFHGAEAELDKAIQSPDKKVLYFTATWCPPCRMIAPVFQSLSEEFTAIKFIKIDIDEYGDTASSFNIQSVPTFIFMKDGQVQSKVRIPSRLTRVPVSHSPCPCVHGNLLHPWRRSHSASLPCCVPSLEQFSGASKERLQASLTELQK